MCQTASDVAHQMVDYNFGDIENVILIHDDLIVADLKAMRNTNWWFWKGQLKKY